MTRIALALRGLCPRTFNIRTVKRERPVRDWKRLDRDHVLIRSVAAAPGGWSFRKRQGPFWTPIRGRDPKPIDSTSPASASPVS